MSGRYHEEMVTRDGSELTVHRVCESHGNVCRYHSKRAVALVLVLTVGQACTVSASWIISFDWSCVRPM